MCARTLLATTIAARFGGEEEGPIVSAQEVDVVGGVTPLVARRFYDVWRCELKVRGRRRAIHSPERSELRFCMSTCFVLSQRF